MSAVVQCELSRAAARLARAGVDSPLLDSQLMLARVLTTSRLGVIAHPGRPLSPAQAAEFQRTVERRESREPLAYILGTREFFSLDFQVTPGVLIPRPETELLVEIAVDRLAGRSVRIADIGTGSGAVAVAAAVNIPSALMLATDVSDAALEVAAANAAKHLVTDRVSFSRGDLLEPLVRAGGAFDAVLCNPPYVPTSEIAALQPEVSRWEPIEALDGGPDGLDVFRKLLPEAVSVLAEDGFLAVEVGAGQARGVRGLALAAGYGSVECFKDLAGIERVVVVSR